MQPQLAAGQRPRQGGVSGGRQDQDSVQRPRAHALEHLAGAAVCRGLLALGGQQGLGHPGPTAARPGHPHLTGQLPLRFGLLCLAAHQVHQACGEHRHGLQS